MREAISTTATPTPYFEPENLKPGAGSKFLPDWERGTLRGSFSMGVLLPENYTPCDERAAESYVADHATIKIQDMRGTASGVMTVIVERLTVGGKRRVRAHAFLTSK